jgi:hypothetical protein
VGVSKNRSQALLLALAAGQTVQAAALAAGLSERTVWRYLADPAFKARLIEVRAQAIERAAAALGNGCSQAVEALTQLLAAKSETVRLGAARAILELGPRLRESVEFHARLAALEKKVR